MAKAKFDRDGRDCERRIVAKRTPARLPLAPLPDLLRWWRAQRTRGIVIGGLAVSLLGRPRVTRDVDGLVLLEGPRWAGFLNAGARQGFEARIPDALSFAADSRVLLLRHQSTGIDIDVSLGCLAFEYEAVARARTMRISGLNIPLPTPEDLIIMKAVAHRERDLHDIDSLLAVQPRVDSRRILRWLREFADALESPEIYEDIQRRLAKRTKSGGSALDES